MSYQYLQDKRTVIGPYFDTCIQILAFSLISLHHSERTMKEAHRSAVVDLFDDMESWCISVGSNSITSIKLATFICERTTELLNVSLSCGLCHHCLRVG